MQVQPANTLDTDQTALVICPLCHHQGYTQVKMVAGRKSYQLSMILYFLVLGIIGCMVGLHANSFKDAVHYCEACHKPIARLRKSL